MSKPPPNGANQALAADDWLKQVEAILKSARAESLTPEQLMAKLRELPSNSTSPVTSPAIVSERVTRGYKVRRSVALLTEEEHKARQAVTLQAVAQALKELRP
jgi:hypothetical protein